MTKLRDLSSGPFLLILMAAAGAALLWMPGRVMSQYQSLQSLGPMWANIYLGCAIAGGVLVIGALGVGGWRLWQNGLAKSRRRQLAIRNPSQLSAAEIETEVAGNLAEAQRLQSEPNLSPEVRNALERLADRVSQKQQTQRLEIVAFGTISSGKSALLNSLAGRDLFRTDPRGGTTTQRQEIAWPLDERVVLVDTPGLGEVDGAEHVSSAAQCASSADLVLLVVDGPLRESEFSLLRLLGQMEKRLIVCLNKSDIYSQADQAKLISQLQKQLQGMVDAEDFVAVRAQVTSRERVLLLADGTEKSELVQAPADIAPLAARMLAILSQDSNQLLLHNLLLQSRGLVENAKQEVQASIDKRAWETVDWYMWSAGGAAALSPLPLIDLFAGSAIVVKMVVDLAGIYRQPMDIKTAAGLLGQLGKNLVAILGVNLATPAVGMVVTSLFKSVPLAGQLAGGLMQGVMQALIARWIGAVFIEYFRSEMRIPPEGLANIAKQEWHRLTAPAELMKLVQQARDKFHASRPPDTPG